MALPPGVRLLHALGCNKPPPLNSATSSLQALTLWLLTQYSHYHLRRTPLARVTSFTRVMLSYSPPKS
ncbi:hypothetical protein LguiA_007174 [Lonicera macranthoides]